MSFMFNPYPYDDPDAVNHIAMGDEFLDSVTQSTAETAKKLVNELCAVLERRPNCILAIDGFISAPFLPLAGQISIQASLKGIPVTTRSTEELWLAEPRLRKMLHRYLPTDTSADPPLLYGRLYRGGLTGLMDPQAAQDLAQSLKAFRTGGAGLLILYGNGALSEPFRDYFDTKIYVDMTQKRTILNIRMGKCGNIGIRERGTYNEMLRHSYYVDFEASFPLRQEVIRDNIADYYLTGDHPDHIQMLSVQRVKDLFSVMTTYPLRCRPVYIEGIWGGHYVQRLRNLPKEMKNCAWVFDLIPMEVSLVADLGEFQLEFPFYFFVQMIGPKLMGEKVSEIFHGYFPIRFNYDDTWHSGGNMSIQVHPDGAYIRENNDELGRQDESYYIVAAGQEAKTYCGFAEDADVGEFLALARRAETLEIGFDHDRFVNSVPSVPGMQFLIPAGTIHASGRNQVILEIGSLTIGSYTYKLYDYLRSDLDGRMRPIHTFHGERVLNRTRKAAWVRDNLIPAPRLVREGDGYTETVVGEQDLLYFSLRNVRFWDRYEDATSDRFHVLVLVEGERCIIRSLGSPERYFIQNYLDMVIVPAGFGPYEVENLCAGPAVIHKTLLKDGYEYDALS